LDQWTNPHSENQFEIKIFEIGPDQPVSSKGAPPVKGYVIVDIQILDPGKFETYKRLAASSIAQHGGNYIARGGKIEPLEGGWTPQRLVIVEFPSVEQAKAWYNSPEYAPAKKIREESARSKLLIVEGAS
jgi:uncharacterized protein (DUF1330 family)